MINKIIGIIIGILVFAGIVYILLMISSWIERANVYVDTQNQKKMEYCFSQQKTFDDCWLSVYRPYKYQEIK